MSDENVGEQSHGASDLVGCCEIWRGESRIACLEQLDEETCRREMLDRGGTRFELKAGPCSC